MRAARATVTWARGFSLLGGGAVRTVLAEVRSET